MTHTEYANALRRIADWIETHPEVPLPSATSLDITAVSGRESLSAVARAFGTATKEYSDSLIYLIKDFGGVSLRVIEWRSNVCKRVVVGKTTVPEKILPAQLIPAHEEDVVEWRCDEPLLTEAAKEAQ